MEYDKEKIDEVVLALLYLNIFDDGYGSRAWKGMPWEVMYSLAEKGYIGDPKNKNRSVPLSEEGEKKAEEFFKKHFAKKE